MGNQQSPRAPSPLVPPSPSSLVSPVDAAPRALTSPVIVRPRHPQDGSILKDGIYFFTKSSCIHCQQCLPEWQQFTRLLREQKGPESAPPLLHLLYYDDDNNKGHVTNVNDVQKDNDNNSGGAAGTTNDNVHFIPLKSRALAKRYCDILGLKGFPALVFVVNQCAYQPDWFNWVPYRRAPVFQLACDTVFHQRRKRSSGVGGGAGVNGNGKAASLSTTSPLSMRGGVLTPDDLKLREFFETHVNRFTWSTQLRRAFPYSSRMMYEAEAARHAFVPCHCHV